MRAGLSLLACLCFLPTTRAAENTAKPVDVVLCLDTSGSMDGLIDSARRKLWTIVNDLAKAEPTPNLRVALYSYGNNSYDRATGWVRKETDLTTDLDEVYKKLHALKIASTGSEEYVARVGQAALASLKWSTEKDGLRLLFICGNEPVDQDKDVTLESVADSAKARGVQINTIYCGTASHLDATGWQTFAAGAGGKYANIDQNKTAAEVAISTPFDAEIQKLGIKINDTFVWFGAKGEAGKANQLAQDANASRAAGGAATERSLTKAGRLYKNECDLVEKLLTEKDFDLKKIKVEDMPEEMKKLKVEARDGYLKKKAADRAEIQKKVTELTSQRALYIEAERKKQPVSAADRALDEALRAILREQAASKGMKFKD